MLSDAQNKQKKEMFLFYTAHIWVSLAGNNYK